jgi:hypothetical protein
MLYQFRYPRRVSSLNSFSRNDHSQFGEDGILEEVFKRIMVAQDQGVKYFVEFGAWDGKTCSNTWSLVEKDFAGLYIEGSKARFKLLVKNCSRYPKIRTENAFVTSTGDDSLENILRRNGAPLNFDLLSIDIDGNDYHIWHSLELYIPSVVCIEYNFTIPMEVNYVQPNDSGRNIGSSANALIELGRLKGYTLIAATKTNLIFVLNEFKHLFGDLTKPVEVPVAAPVYMWGGYDGSVHLSQTFSLEWHPVAISDGVIQVLPSFLRKYSENYTGYERFFFRLSSLYWKLRNKIAKS